MASQVTKALEDAERVIALAPNWEKGWMRKAAVLEEQGLLEQALEAYQQASNR